MGEISFEYGKHGVFESTDLKNTKVGHFYNLISDVDIDNGSVAKIGDYVAQDYFNADIPQVGDKIVLIMTAPKIYGEYTRKWQEETNFFNAAGELMRAGEIQDTDRFGLNAYAFDENAVPEEGKYVVVNGTDYKLTTMDTEPDKTTYGFIGYIYRQAKNGTYLIFVKQNVQL